jgi:hypothetical protein
VSITVTASQVPGFLKGAASDADVTAALSWAASAVEAYCERNFSYVANDVVLIDPFPVKRSAQLPNPPIQSVSTVEAYMRDATGQMSWQTLVNWAWTADGLLYDTTGQPGTQISEVPSWPALPKSLRVTYTHGFMDTPQPVVDQVIKLAATYLTNPFNMTSRKVGDVEMGFSVSLLQSAGGGLDEAVLGKYRLISVPR